MHGPCPLTPSPPGSSRGSTDGAHEVHFVDGRDKPDKPGHDARKSKHICARGRTALSDVDLRPLRPVGQSNSHAPREPAETMDAPEPSQGAVPGRGRATGMTRLRLSSIRSKERR